MAESDRVDIIIVTHNAKRLLKNCISSIRKHTQSVKYLITVVDNGSRDGTVNFLEKQKDINLIKNHKNLGFSAAANIGIRETRNDLIICLDDDVEVTRDWIHGLLHYIKDKNVGIVGCKILYASGRIHSGEYRIKPLSLAGHGEIDLGQVNYIRNVDALIGPCWLMKREVVKKIGYFDTRFFPCQHEDIDFCLRARLGKYKIIYNGKTEIIHHNLFRDRDLFNKNWLKFIKKWRNIEYPFPDSHPADKHNAKAYLYYKNCDFKKALVEFEKVKKIDRRLFVTFWAGMTHIMLRRYKNALEEFERLRKFDSLKNKYRIIFLIGLMNEKLEKHKEAIVNYKEVVKIKPHNLHIRSKIAQLYEILGKFKKSINEYDKIIYAARKASKADMVLLMNRIKQQIMACKRNLKKIPHDSESRLRLAISYRNIGWLKNAINEYTAFKNLIKDKENSLKKEMKLNSRLIQLSLTKAGSMNGSKQYLNKLKIKIRKCKRAIKASFSDIEPHLQLAICYEKLKLLKKSMNKYNTVTSLVNKKIDSIKKSMLPVCKLKSSSSFRWLKKEEVKPQTFFQFFK